MMKPGGGELDDETMLFLTILPCYQGRQPTQSMPSLAHAHTAPAAVAAAPAGAGAGAAGAGHTSNHDERQLSKLNYQVIKDNNDFVTLMP